jgi:hypothetical protein
MTARAVVALAATRAARLIWAPVTVTAPFALCTPLAAPGWRLALLPIGVAVTSFGQALYNIGQISFRQALCPPELLGRMNASIRFLVFGALPLGGLLAGRGRLRNVAGTRDRHAAEVPEGGSGCGGDRRGRPCWPGGWPGWPC